MSMKQHNLKQGSAEWHAYRRNHFNASDAPAMMGCSSYETRDQLLHRYFTGLSEEVSPEQQERFNDGHRFERLARPIAEKIIGQALYPVVGSNGKLSASFDGLTIVEDINYEHKSLNDKLREALVEGATGADLPLMYRVQMEQQHMVSAADKTLFMASKWRGEQLLEERHCWYTPDPELAKQIDAGWAQFAIDLAAYVPPETVTPVTAEAVEMLPVPSVRMDGAIKVIDNLELFGTKLRAFVAKIEMKPSTDQEFANADAAAKTLEKAQSALEQAEAAALANVAPVEAMRRVVAEYVELARTTRLTLERVVKARKLQIREEIVLAAQTAFRAHHKALNARLSKPYMPDMAPDFDAAVKNKRTVDSLRDAVNTTLAHAKIEANDIADKIHTNLEALRTHASKHAMLFADAAALVLKANDDLLAVITNRIGEHDRKEAARLEAERERIAAEERQKAEAAAAENTRKAAEAAAAKAREEERQCIEEERAAARLAQPTPVAPPIVAPAPVQSSTVVAMKPRAAAPTAAPAERNSIPTLRIGAINDRFGDWKVSEDGLRGLGIEPSGRERSNPLYHEADFPRICRAISARAERLADEHENHAAKA